ncbi:MAG: flagellar basal body-associated FliL family protein [Symbiobacterium sp.]|jgi:Flagellar basal body-associated protein FliL.|uniref:flagellar basal body-associated protein FliL n=1 Tax=Symbiobacterium sp. TaxID=1971213 RepID=UPI003463CDC7
MNRGLITALVAAVVILAVGVAGLAAYVFLFMPQTGGAVGAEETATVSTGRPATEAAYYELNEFVTNLADTDRIRYIQFSVALGLRSTESEAIVEENEPLVRDAVLTQVRGLTSKDLIGSDGKDRLAQTVQEALGHALPGHVTKVYVTDMFIQ